MWECCATLRTSPSPCGSPRTPSTGWSTPRGWARTAPAWPSTSSRRFLSFIVHFEPKIHLPPGLDHLHPSLALVQHDVHGCGGGDGVLQHSCRPAPPQACHQPGSYNGWSDESNSSHHQKHEHCIDKDHLIGFRDEATMFDVDTKARREPLPMTSTSGTFEPVLHYTMVCKNSESKSLSLWIKDILKGEREKKRVYAYSKY